MRKFLIFGLGSIGQRHVRMLRQALGDQAEIHAFRSRGLDQVIQDNMQVLPGATIRGHYGIHVHTDLEAALSVGAAAAFITNPISMHVDTARMAVDRGCHLFIEKPLGNDTAGLRGLRSALARAGKVAAVGYQLRFHPALVQVRSMLQSGRLGRLISASLHFGEWLPGMHPYEDYRISHASRNDQGGGAILCLSHEIDYACWLFGWPRRVFALGGKLSSLEMDVEDTADLLLDCGPAGHPVPVSVHVDFVQRPPRRGCRIVGEDACLEWNYFTNSLVLTPSTGGAPESFSFDGFKRNDMFAGQLANFLSAMDGAALPVCPLDEGIRTLQVCLAARESIRSGAAVVPEWIC